MIYYILTCTAYEDEKNRFSSYFSSASAVRTNSLSSGSNYHDISISRDAVTVSAVCPRTDAAHQYLSSQVHKALTSVRESSTTVSECGNGIW